jgi:hypothetical protein
MIGQTNQDVGGDVEPRNVANSVGQGASPGQVESAADGDLPQFGQIAAKPVPKAGRSADARALEAHIERRRRLAAQIRVEDPLRTEEEIEARLEQFGV